MRLSLPIVAVALMAACSQVNPISETEQVDVDCLASIAVVEITDYISAGGAAGTPPEDLMHIIPDKIAEAQAKFETKYAGNIDSAYLEHEIHRRLTRFENAITTGDQESLDFINMTETVELGRSCTFGA